MIYLLFVLLYKAAVFSILLYSIETQVQLLKGLLVGLSEVHSLGIVHHSISPANSSAWVR